jgi:hypothetical protein
MLMKEKGCCLFLFMVVLMMVMMIGVRGIDASGVPPELPKSFISLFVSEENGELFMNKTAFKIPSSEGKYVITLPKTSNEVN